MDFGFGFGYGQGLCYGWSYSTLQTTTVYFLCPENTMYNVSVICAAICTYTYNPTTERESDTEW